MLDSDSDYHDYSNLKTPLEEMLRSKSDSKLLGGKSNRQLEMDYHSIYKAMTLSIATILLICALTYFIYILLGDCFTSMILAFITSQLLRNFK